MFFRTGSDHMISRLVVVFFLLAFCISITGYLYYNNQQRELKKNIQDELSAIADLKVNQVIAWRKERIGDADIIMNNNLISARIDQFRKNPATSGLKKDIQTWLTSLQDNYDYKIIFLVDPKGEILLSTDQRNGSLSPQSRKWLDDALRTKNVVFTDLHTSDNINIVHIDLIAPIFLHTQNTSQPLGAVIFLIDPEMFLYPLIQTWPGLSKTAETLLIRREKDEIVFLNELRHRKNAALSLRVPLSKHPALASLLEKEGSGLLDTHDYRDVPVLANIQPVPATSWLLVSKIDEDEVYAPIREQARLLAIVITLLITAAGLSIIFWWRRQSAVHAQQQSDAQLKSETLSRRYDYLSKYANDIILLVDRSGRIIEANERAIGVYGYAHEELTRLTINDLRPREEWRDIDQQFHKVQERDGLIYETVHLSKKGQQFPVEVSARAIDVEGNKLFQAIIRDITERKQSEKKILHLNRLYAVLSEVNQVIVRTNDRDQLFQDLCRIAGDVGGFKLAWIGLVDTNTGQVKTASHYGQGDEYLENIRVTINDEPEGRGPTGSAIREKNHVICMDIANDPRMSPWKEHALKQGYHSSGAFPVLQQDRVIGAFTLYSDEIDFFRDDEVKLLDEIALDISFALDNIDKEARRNQAEQALLENEVRYKYLIESITDYIFTVEVTNGRVTATTHGPGCITVTGYTAEEYQADPNLWYQMVHEEDRPAVLEQAEMILSGKRIAPLEHRIIHKNGSIRWVKNTPVPRFDQAGELVAYDGLVTNITDLKYLEVQLRQAQKMEAIGQLAGGVAHDFNNILTAIIGYGNLLKMKIHEGDPLRHNVDQILASAERAANLTSNLLAYSRKQIINPKTVSMNSIVLQVEKLLQRLIGEDIEFRTVLTDADLIVMADVGQMEQVLMNLSTNARDAMPAGGILTLETERVELSNEFVKMHAYGESGSYALISISDTGIGMDETTKERIFDPFFTTKEVGKGTGLGLAMVYGIIKQHSGYINVYSEPGKGTTFKIYLPLALSAIEAPVPETGSILPRGTETVLLAEDDKTVRNLTKTILENFGYTVIAAVDGEDAIQKFVEHRDVVELLILDIIMPKRNGKEVAEEIQKIQPGIKILYTSGYTADIVHKKGILEESVNFISKPISPMDFLSKVREVLDKG